MSKGGAWEALDWAKTILIALAAAFFVTNFIIINAVVPSGSMENTIMPGDRLFGSRLTYKFSEPERGDVVVFRYPVNEALLERVGKDRRKYSEFLKEYDVRKINYIKRIIGLPGETVEIRDGKIYVDGSSKPLDEPYLKEKWTVENDGYLFEIPEGSYLMLGDNRNDSADSRYWAGEAAMLFGEAGFEISDEELYGLCFVKREAILGKATLRYWPLNRITALR